MNKKQVIGILVIFFFVAVSAYATKTKDQPQKPITVDDIVAKMTAQLGLSDEQASKVKPIIEEHIAKEKQLKQQEAKELRKVLTDQQMYSWNFLQQEQEQPKTKKKHSAF